MFKTPPISRYSKELEINKLKRDGYLSVEKLILAIEKENYDFGFDYVCLKYVEVYGKSPAGTEYFYTGLVNRDGVPHGFGRR